jgi:branched-chain amino acid transport system ATP-binding protein
VSASYGHVQALREIDLEVGESELVALIGANGAGKTSTMRLISGLLRPTTGDIDFEGRSIRGLSPHAIIQLGIAHCPEGRGVFPMMTVHENLAMGAYIFRDVDKREFDRVYAYFPVLAERRRQLAGTLSGGEQQMLAIARALMARPKLLLLDEPSMGLAPLFVERLGELIRQFQREKRTILLVEQNAYLALNIADRGYVLENGRVVLVGSGPDLLHDRHIKKAYLGIDA